MPSRHSDPRRRRRSSYDDRDRDKDFFRRRNSDRSSVHDNYDGNGNDNDDNDTPSISPARRGSQQLRDLFRPRSGTSSAQRPSAAIRTYSRDASRTLSDASPSKRKVYNIVDFGMERRASASRLSGSRSSTTPYPSFSKAHSREAVDSRDDAASRPRYSSYTPDATDLAERLRSSDRPSNTRASWAAGAPPPSPPLTADSSNMRRVHSGSSMGREADKAVQEMTSGTRSVGGPSQRDAGLRFSASRTSLRDAEEGRSSKNPSRQPSTAGPSPLRNGARSPPPSAAGAAKSLLNSTRRKSASGVSQPTDSDATSILPEKRQNGRPPTLLSHRGASPPSDPESFPRTPNGHDAEFFDAENDQKEGRSFQVFTATGSGSDSAGNTRAPPPLNAGAVPPPPPPPPPLEVAAAAVPKVDYLLPNGGLQRQITKKFVSAANPHPPQAYQQYMSPQAYTPKPADAHIVFAPYQSLLDDIDRVMARSGSVAVATGYKSVSRRLLDRLETVFARNISSQFCACVICKTGRQDSKSPAIDSSVSWGEVLELVSGRRERPLWPPFSLPTSATGLGVSGLDHKPPMQKLDVDVPEEYREHYIRQSRKTKVAVDKWLASQPEDHTSPPNEVDDETLIFAMLTYLEPDQRRMFTALVRGLSVIPDARTPTPAPTDPKTDLMAKVGTALQRLYRLPKPPREPESSMFLLRNPSLHNALATLAAISNQEWEILISGRFDGFLVSGAESQFPSMGPIPSRGVTPFSRGTTPCRNTAPSSYFPPSAATPFRNTGAATPSSAKLTSGSNTPTTTPNTPGPVQLDEETEIAVLAEVEREIFLGMEALEDAFETLHVKAEGVRKALRERGAGLSLQARAMGRRGSERELDARLGTPFDGGVAVMGSGLASGTGTPVPAWGFASQSNGHGGGLGAGESDDGLDDAASLAPDDSASNVGWKDRKHRHHRRRRPRRTPAPVDEVSE